jgi:uncharacterized protein (DUF39 family)
VGYVAWQGTQHNPGVVRGENGVPRRPAGTLAVIGDLKQMKSDWLRGISMQGYGASMIVGIGVPIPILSEEILKCTTVTDADIVAPIVDYSETYPQRKPDILGEVSYSQLKTGTIEVKGKKVPTSSLSSYPKAVEIARILKEWLQKGEFTLTEPVASLPGPESGITIKSLEERSIEP